MNEPEPGYRDHAADREPEINLSVEVIRSSGGWDALGHASKIWLSRRQAGPCGSETGPSGQMAGTAGEGDTLDAAIEAAARGAFGAGLASGKARICGDSFDGGYPAELSIVLACDEFVQGLNRQFRGQDKPTNVLSFPAEPFPAVDFGDEPAPLGDIIVAWETLLREAEAEGKAALDHLLHLVVHGTLHLLGFDHQGDDEAERMEALEREALARLGVADPYREPSDSEIPDEGGQTGKHPTKPAKPAEHPQRGNTR